MKIGIAGSGGIGSNVAVHLVRAGVKELKFGDFDVIEESNLNRQFYFKDQIGKYKAEMLYENLKRINPDGDFQYNIIKFERENIKEFFQDCDIIIEGFDKKEYKSMLVEELYPLGKLIISASGIASYDCKEIQIKETGKNLYIVGDFQKDISCYKTYSHKVSVIAALMTEIALKRGGYIEE
ncbi:sulfur carrier protein ThiS adenylyltransferase ThiF [Fusobacterium varium]|uniref:sulfur carrier protein ThiS adenylyltransferase ThiF n=1 Tax=Fusobacterium varium TaxID=856 RepID=UPI00259A494D|nr:sulfur carrier protein ThiS adenylyltransferase ThiF [uncultured Fusobacterium sp.]